MGKVRARGRKVDISAIEASLDASLADTINIGSAVATQPDSSLFFVDQVGVTDAQEIKKLKEKGVLGGSRPLKIDEILKPQSKVPPIGNNNRNGGVGGEAKLIRKMMKTVGGKSEKVIPKNTTENLDVWGESDSQNDKNHTRKSKPSNTVAAVQLPEGGISYHPDPVEHQVLYEKISMVEEQQKEEAAKAAETLRPLALLTTSTLLKVCLSSDDETPTATTADDDQTPILEDNMQVVGQLKKSDIERRREQRKRIAKEERLRQEEEKRKLKRDIERLPEIIAEVQQQVRRPTKLRRTRKRQDISKVETIPTLVNAPEEIAECLRRVKTEGNLVEERFKSLQERSLIESSYVKKSKKNTAKVSWILPRSIREFN